MGWFSSKCPFYGECTIDGSLVTSMGEADSQTNRVKYRHFICKGKGEYGGWPGCRNYFIKAAQASKGHTKVNVVLESCSANKLACAQLICEITGISLSEAQNIVDTAPTSIIKGCSEERAVALQVLLEEIGAKVEFQRY